MPDLAVKARRQGWSPRKFARAVLDGMTNAEAAQAAGSNALTPDSLKVAGYRMFHHPRVQALLSGDSEALTVGWRRGTEKVAMLAQGVSPTGQPVTHFDLLAAWNGIGRALGKFVQRVDVTHSGVIAYERLSRSEAVDHARVIDASLPRAPVAGSLAAATDDELRAELARRVAGKALPSGLPSVT